LIDIVAAAALCDVENQTSGKGASRSVSSRAAWHLPWRHRRHRRHGTVVMTRLLRLQAKPDRPSFPAARPGIFRGDTAGTVATAAAA